MKTLPLLCAALLLVSGCAGRDYAIPDQGLMNAAQIEESYRVDREWWKAYGDEALNRLVDTALERNLDLARSTISVNRTLYQARQLGANLVPSFSASGDASSRTDMESGQASRSFNATFGLAYELDLWGRLRNAASAGAWEYRATEQDRESTRLALINSVVNTWYSMAQTTRSLELSRESLTFYERLLAIVQAQYAAGKTDGLDPAQTEQSLLSQQATVLTLEQQLAEEKRTLRDLLNLRPEEELNLTPPDPLSVAVPEVDLSVPVAALGLRPDVNAAACRLLSGFRNQEAAKGDLFPALSISGTLGASAASFSDFFSAPFVKGLVNLSLPFLDWNRVKWNVRIAEADFEDAKLSFQKSVTQALNEVALYYHTLGNAKQQLENMKKKYEADLRVEAYRKARYEQGADELKDYLEALKAGNDSRLSVLEKSYEVISASNAVWQAMGGRILSR
ncbi:TolC family protein [Mailhella massiliensis]|uniref:TolC family protein n=1 Tax=Mailhella massiliensis TaxID=1903261 RepID=UPI0023F3904B|nr:TolC family protein [Mailhella massiliensis]